MQLCFLYGIPPFLVVKKLRQLVMKHLWVVGVVAGDTGGEAGDTEVEVVAGATAAEVVDGMGVDGMVGPTGPPITYHPIHNVL